MKYKALQLTERQAGLLAGLLEREFDNPKFKEKSESNQELQRIHAKLRILYDGKW